MREKEKREEMREVEVMREEKKREMEPPPTPPSTPTSSSSRLPLYFLSTAFTDSKTFRLPIVPTKVVRCLNPHVADTHTPSHTSTHPHHTHSTMIPPSYTQTLTHSAPSLHTLYLRTTISPFSIQPKLTQSSSPNLTVAQEKCSSSVNLKLQCQYEYGQSIGHREGSHGVR